MYHDEEREALPDIEVKGSLNREIGVEYGEDFSYLSTENEDFSQIEKNIEWQANVEAPVKAGDPVGVYIYTLNGKEIGRVPVVATEDADKAGYLDYLNEMWKRWAI